VDRAGEVTEHEAEALLAELGRRFEIAPGLGDEELAPAAPTSVPPSRIRFWDDLVDGD
jgi:hypothetical protein